MAVTITTAAARRTSTVATPVVSAVTRPVAAPAPKRRQLRKPQATTPQNSVPFTVSNRPYGVIHRLATDPTYGQRATRPAATGVAPPGQARADRRPRNRSRPPARGQRRAVLPDAPAPRHVPG